MEIEGRGEKDSKEDVQTAKKLPGWVRGIEPPAPRATV